MRILFSLLLTLLTAAGTFFPCCMHDDCADTVAVTAAADHPEDEGDEACSPFFACGTCPAAVEVAKAPVLDGPVASLPPTPGSMYLVQLASFAAEWFQPPRLG